MNLNIQIPEILLKYVPIRLYENYLLSSSNNNINSYKKFFGEIVKYIETNYYYNIIITFEELYNGNMLVNIENEQSFNNYMLFNYPEFLI